MLDSEAAKQDLVLLVERIERLEEEKAAIASDVKEVFAEAKAKGYDVKALRTALRIKKQDQNERKEQEAILEIYLDALGLG